MKVIQVEHLKKSYKDVVAVKEVSFEIHAGEIFGIVGPNGAGKTTVIECVIGLRRPDKCRLQVLGHDPLTGSHKFKQKIGVQLQDYRLRPCFTKSSKSCRSCLARSGCCWKRSRAS